MQHCHCRQAADSSLCFGVTRSWEQFDCFFGRVEFRKTSFRRGPFLSAPVEKWVSSGPFRALAFLRCCRPSTMSTATHSLEKRSMSKSPFLAAALFAVAFAIPAYAQDAAKKD